MSTIPLSLHYQIYVRWYRPPSEFPAAQRRFRVGITGPNARLIHLYQPNADAHSGMTSPLPSIVYKPDATLSAKPLLFSLAPSPADLVRIPPSVPGTVLLIACRVRTNVRVLCALAPLYVLDITRNEIYVRLHFCIGAVARMDVGFASINNSALVLSLRNP